jgi:hypothetical protein
MYVILAREGRFLQRRVAKPETLPAIVEGAKRSGWDVRVVERPVDVAPPAALPTKHERPEHIRERRAVDIALEGERLLAEAELESWLTALKDVGRVDLFALDDIPIVVAKRPHRAASIRTPEQVAEGLVVGLARQLADARRPVADRRGRKSIPDVRLAILHHDHAPAPLTCRFVAEIESASLARAGWHVCKPTWSDRSSPESILGDARKLIADALAG